MFVFDTVTYIYICILSDFPLPSEILEKQLTIEELEIISKRIEQSYVVFFIELGFSLESIKQLTLTNPGHCSKDVTFMGLKIWKYHYLKGATVRRVLNALRMCEMSIAGVVECIKDMESSLRPESSLFSLFLYQQFNSNICN